MNEQNILYFFTKSLILVIITSIVVTNIILIVELQNLKNTIFLLENNLENISKAISNQQMTFDNNYIDLQHVKNVSSHSNNVITASLVGTILVLFGGALFYLTGFDSSHFSESFSLLSNHTTENINSLSQLNTKNFIKIFECFGQNQSHIKSVTEAFMQQFKNLNSSIIQILNKTNIESLKDSAMNGRWE